MDENRLPFWKAVIWILVSTLLISGTSLMGWLYFLQLKNKRFHDEQYKITSILQKTDESNRLTTGYLAEKLGLSIDHPINLYQFNANEGEKRLLNEPFIRRANIKKILPGTLFIDYELRHPIAVLGDFSNTLIDSRGILFSYPTFISANKFLPVFYLGLEQTGGRRGERLSHDHFSLGKKILNDFQKLNIFELQIELIDLSRLVAQSDGRREIILKLKKDGNFLYLRIHVDQWKQALVNFFTAYEWQSSQSMRGFKNQTQFDFRIPHLGFIQES